MKTHIVILAAAAAATAAMFSPVADAVTLTNPSEKKRLIRAPVRARPLTDAQREIRVETRRAHARTPFVSDRFSALNRADDLAALPPQVAAMWKKHGALRSAALGTAEGVPYVSATLGTPKLPIAKMIDYDNELWVAELSIGQPAQGPFRVILDSGSSNLWVPSRSCNDTGCLGKHKYDAGASSTARPESVRPWAIPYGTGFAAGTFVLDNVHLAGVTVTNMSLGQADIVAAFFENTPIDGIAGLAFEDISVGHEKPVFDYMCEQGLVEKCEFSVYLSGKDATYNSEVVFGGTDPFHYTGDFVYADVLLPSYWVTGMETITVAHPSGSSTEHKCGLDYCLAVIDTGTSAIVGPPYALDPIIKSIGHVAEDCSNVGSLPTVSFKIGGHDLPLAPEYYVLSETFSNGTAVCQLGIQAMWLTSPFYILGDPFLRAYYSVFDKSGIIPRVGFAKSR